MRSRRPGLLLHGLANNFVGDGEVGLGEVRLHQLAVFVERDLVLEQGRRGGQVRPSGPVPAQAAANRPSRGSGEFGAPTWLASKLDASKLSKKK